MEAQRRVINLALGKLEAHGLLDVPVQEEAVQQVHAEDMPGPPGIECVRLLGNIGVKGDLAEQLRFIQTIESCNNNEGFGIIVAVTEFTEYDWQFQMGEPCFVRLNPYTLPSDKDS